MPTCVESLRYIYLSSSSGEPILATPNNMIQCFALIWSTVSVLLLVEEEKVLLVQTNVLRMCKKKIVFLYKKEMCFLYKRKMFFVYRRKIVFLYKNRCSSCARTCSSCTERQSFLFVHKEDLPLVQEEAALPVQEHNIFLYKDK